MRGWGKSEGRDDCGLFQSDDTVRVGEWLALQPGIDSARIGILGFSQGGQVALQAASRSDQFKIVIAVGPATDVSRWADTTSHGSISYYIAENCKPKWRERSPLFVADQIKVPVLLIHGAEDTRVPTEQSQLMHQSIQEAGGKAELRLVQGLGHSFHRFHWNIVWPWIIETLDKTLGHRGVNHSTKDQTKNGP